ncbi:MAG: tRNA epoxyqueuosine(34) reductase QueG [Burkholderiales bacterium]|nr:tRNA epoxyqueuosine(34) reductase QueG [Burkholderiales bacterium]
MKRLRGWADELGFSQIGVAGVDLHAAEAGMLAWLQAGFHGGMGYMARHGLKRARPADLVPGTLRVITVRLDYLPRQLIAHGTNRQSGAVLANTHDADKTPSNQAASEGDGQGDWRADELSRLQVPGAAVVSVYARGRDYHKVMRARLQTLTERIEAHIGPCGHRVFCDSAPVLEAELASRSGLGWRGKHTLVLARDAGSMFFLGEIYVDLALPLSEPATAHCGSCSACLDICPTQAIVAPYRLDARRCISYLTIEHEGAIPLELRRAMGTRIYGCDDCQLACPWNRFAKRSALPDFDVRAPVDAPRLLDLWRWSEADFLRLTEGSAIRRIGYGRWRRNLAVALGNTLRGHGDPVYAAALCEALDGADDLLREHIAWALDEYGDNAKLAAPAA